MKDKKLAFFFLSEEERKDFAKRNFNPLASAINVGTEKDSLESFYIFKLKLKNEDSLSYASSSQKCKHCFELLLEGESNFFRERRNGRILRSKSLILSLPP